MKSITLLKLVVAILDEHKAQDIVKLDVRKLTDITDYMVICSGTSSRHVKALTDNILTKVKAKKITPLSTSEDPSGGWNLVDLGDIIVHIMLQDTREFYALEKLWNIKLHTEKI